MLAIAAGKGMRLAQFDVSNAFTQAVHLLKQCMYSNMTAGIKGRQAPHKRGGRTGSRTGSLSGGSWELPAAVSLAEAARAESECDEPHRWARRTV